MTSVQVSVRWNDQLKHVLFWHLTLFKGTCWHSHLVLDHSIDVSYLQYYVGYYMSKWINNKQVSNTLTPFKPSNGFLNVYYHLYAEDNACMCLSLYLFIFWAISFLNTSVDSRSTSIRLIGHGHLKMKPWLFNVEIMPRFFLHELPIKFRIN